MINLDDDEGSFVLLSKLGKAVLSHLKKTAKVMSYIPIVVSFALASRGFACDWAF